MDRCGASSWPLDLKPDVCFWISFQEATFSVGSQGSYLLCRRGIVRSGHRRLPRCLMQKMQWNDHFIALFWLPRSVIWGANVVGLPSYETRQKTGASLGTIANDGTQCHTYMGPGPFDDRACPSIFKSWRVGWCHIPQEVWLARVERTWQNLRSESLSAAASCMIVSLSFLGKKS